MEESNFIEFQVQLSGQTTNDYKKTKEIQLCNEKEADENCIMRETYNTTLCRVPFYTPEPMVKSWIAKEVTDEMIMNPLG